ncbi:hypothetical protein NEOLEDRAFT_1130555 [Neolentinus lepideus HHB14362 ss-1]|uniref:Uncharacterized protein n=1 Tax=Neolentinus lepideus HHB14362 ss-1 TaxID=1314782 RepID=A0A165U2X9_9AGAM|nr:hypothetical protein NEOLEDRAFT_1130555 [Neolentinus lepideus HHB14362 ss-1]
MPLPWLQKYCEPGALPTFDLITSDLAGLFPATPLRSSSRQRKVRRLSSFRYQRTLRKYLLGVRSLCTRVMSRHSSRPGSSAGLTRLSPLHLYTHLAGLLLPKPFRSRWTSCTSSCPLQPPTTAEFEYTAPGNDDNLANRRSGSPPCSMTGYFLLCVNGSTCFLMLKAAKQS